MFLPVLRSCTSHGRWLNDLVDVLLRSVSHPSTRMRITKGIFLLIRFGRRQLRSSIRRSEASDNNDLWSNDHGRSRASQGSASFSQLTFGRRTLGNRPDAEVISSNAVGPERAVFAFCPRSWGCRGSRLHLWTGGGYYRSRFSSAFQVRSRLPSAASRQAKHDAVHGTAASRFGLISSAQLRQIGNVPRRLQ